MLYQSAALLPRRHAGWLQSLQKLLSTQYFCNLDRILKQFFSFWWTEGSVRLVWVVKISSCRCKQGETLITITVTELNVLHTNRRQGISGKSQQRKSSMGLPANIPILMCLRLKVHGHLNATQDACMSKEANSCFTLFNISDPSQIQAFHFAHTLWTMTVGEQKLSPLCFFH